MPSATPDFRLVSPIDLARQASASFSDAENVKKMELTSELSNGISLAISLLIFLLAGRCGAAECATDLSGWHVVAAAMSAVAVASGRLFRCGTLSPLINARVTLLVSTFNLVWWLVLQVRVWGTHACTAHEPTAECCDPALYHASFAYLVLTYLFIGLMICLLCSMLSFLAGAFASAMATAAEAAANSGAEEESGGSRTAEAATSRGSSMPDLQVRLLAKGEQV